MIEQGLSCKHCGNYFSGKYCNKCGEKVYTDHEKSIPHFFEEAFHFLTHLKAHFSPPLRQYSRGLANSHLIIVTASERITSSHCPCLSCWWYYTSFSRFFLDLIRRFN